MEDDSDDEGLMDMLEACEQAALAPEEPSEMSKMNYIFWLLLPYSLNCQCFRCLFVSSTFRLFPTVYGSRF